MESIAVPGKSDERTVVVPEDFFAALGARLLRDFGPAGAEDVLYELGRDAGRSFVRMTERYFGGPMRSADDFRRVIAMFGREYRWADVDVRTLDLPGKFMLVEWRNGIGVPKGGSPRPVCHLGRGLLSGAAEVAFEEPCDAIETQCQAMGADHCEIVVAVPAKLSGLAEGADRPT
ncbi:MAG TPA: V4R domain-containing protein [Thermoplasmata archaeon]|nr:V4R domain-containing protein [Thermoplasmata archaeon]